MVTEFANSQIFSLDLETTGLNPIDSRILLCQVGFPDKSFVIDASKVKLDPLLPFFNDRHWEKIIQQSEFERKFIQHFYGTKINRVFDTFLAEKLLETDGFVPASLEALALKYAGVKLDKSIRKSFMDAKALSVFSDEQLEYASQDVEVLFPIKDAQLKRILDENMLNVADLEFDVAAVTANMGLAGIPIFVDKWKGILKDTEKKHEESRLRMNALLFDEGENIEQLGMFVRDSINLNSVPQVKKAFAGIGIDIESTNEREISLIDHPAAKELLNYRGLQKIMSSYGDSFLGYIHPFTNRIHAEWKQLGTETGRYSCKNPNLQQMPDEFRQCVGEDDKAIIAADYSQMELRILAELSQDPNFLRAFRSGVDLHKSTAATMFNEPMESITKEKRFIAKTINFGLAYGMGSNKLRDMLNAEAEKNGTKPYSVQQSKTLINKYRSAYKDVVYWLENAGRTAAAKNYSETIYGRRRKFHRPADGIPEEDYDSQMAGIRRQGANSPIQGTNADITKLAMIDIQRELDNNGFSADIIIQVHDEIVVLARKEEAEAVKFIVEASMVSAGEQILKTVPVKVDSYISNVWKKG